MATALPDVLGWIMSSAEDRDIDAIYEAIKRRRDGQALMRTAQLRRGQVVEVTGNISPRYLKGATGVIARVIPGKKHVQVTLSRKQPPGVRLGKYAPWTIDGTEGRTIGIPGSVLTVIDG